MTRIDELTAIISSLETRIASNNIVGQSTNIVIIINRLMDLLKYRQEYFKLQNPGKELPSYLKTENITHFKDFE
jgi:hypothetical protein